MKSQERSDSADLTVLTRILARGTLPPSSMLVRSEVLALLPEGASVGWLDGHVRGRKQRGLGVVYRWGDVDDALFGRRRHSATTDGYLRVPEAAEYLRCSEGALRMLIARGKLVPAGRRGRVLLFTRDGLDRQVRGENAEATVPLAEEAQVADEQPLAAALKSAEVEVATLGVARATHRPRTAAPAAAVPDPFGLRAAWGAAKGKV